MEVTFKKNELTDSMGKMFKSIPYYLSQPVRLFRTYNYRKDFQADLIAGATVAVILLPQAIAFALIAELPPEMGLYAAVMGAFFGSLWGSSNQIHTGPTNAISLLVLSTLLTVATPGTIEFVMAAGLLAVMVGLFQLLMGLARLGILVNFVSHSVVVGFSTGAGVLIAVNQLRRLFGLEFSSHNLVQTLQGVATNIFDTHLATAALGIGTMIFILVLRKINRKLPASLLSMVVASIIVFIMGLDQAGVTVIGQLPTGFPPLADLPIFDLDFISQLSTGALAVGAIGLVETMAIARSIATQTGQRLDSNQEFVGQGLANIASGIFSGYPCAGSFSRSAVNFKSGARTPVSALISSLFVLIGIFVLAPLAVYLPQTALAGVLILTAYSLIDQEEIMRIWNGTRRDAIIMIVTFLGTLFLHIEFAVLLGILLSFGLYIMKTSVPRVEVVLPDEKFKHFTRQPDKDLCPQLGIINILGDLYFGAVSHIEEAIHKNLIDNPGQIFLLIRMQSVNVCDFSGIHTLESIVHTYRDQGGDVFFVRVRGNILKLMKSTGFYEELGPDHFLSEDRAIEHIFYKILDPAICIYECDVRAFNECQNLPKRTYSAEIPPLPNAYTENNITEIPPHTLKEKLTTEGPSLIVIDVREPREYHQGHIPQAQLIPLDKVLHEMEEKHKEDELVFVCRAGRRSMRAALAFKRKGYKNIHVLEGGMLAWENAGLLEAVNYMQAEEEEIEE